VKRQPKNIAKLIAALKAEGVAIAKATMTDAEGNNYVLEFDNDNAPADTGNDWDEVLKDETA